MSPSFFCLICSVEMKQKRCLILQQDLDPALKKADSEESALALSEVMSLLYRNVS